MLIARSVAPGSSAPASEVTAPASNAAATTRSLEIASMVPYDRAYVTAGFKDSPWARYNANRLAHDPQVAARTEGLRCEFAVIRSLGRGQ